MDDAHSELPGIDPETVYETVLRIADEDPKKPDLLSALGVLFSRRYGLLHDSRNLDKAISAYEGAARLTPYGHHNKAHRQSNLGNLLLVRFERQGMVSDIHNAISAHEDAAQSTAENHSDNPSHLSNLGNSLLRRFERLGDIADINKAISTHEHAVRVTPGDHLDKTRRLSNLGNSLLRRFERLGNIADADIAISTHDDAVRLTPDGHPDKPGILNNLSNSLLHRFLHLGAITDIDKAIAAGEDAVRLTPDGHPDKPARLSNLGNSLRTRFTRKGDVVDLDKAICAVEEAVQRAQGDHSHKPALLSNLGNSFRNRFECLGDVVDVNKAISAHDEAVRLTPDGHPDKHTLLNNLGGSFLRRFERLGDIADINRAVETRYDAVKLTPDDHPEKASRLGNLAGSLLCQFERLGNVADIDQAISAGVDAVGLTPDGHPEKPGLLSNLGNSYLHRFEYLGDVTDIDRAISVGTDAVRLTPEGHPDKPSRMSNLCSSYRNRFERLGDVADILEAIAVGGDAVNLIPDGHPEKASTLSNLGNLYLHRFERLGDVTELDKAISAHETAVGLIPEDHPSKPVLLNNVGNSFRSRFLHQGDIADVDKAISAHDHTVRLTPQDHPAMPARLSNLGHSLRIRFERLGDVGDITKAILQFSSAASSSAGSASVRFGAALCWADCTSKVSHSASLDAYSRALDLLPRVAWLGLPIAERHRELANIGSAVQDAAAAAIASEKYDTAFEWLEQGRSVVWSQLLHLRTPLDHLREIDPVLADRFAQVSKHLEHLGTGGVLSEPSHQLSADAIGRKHRLMALEWDGLVEHARAIPGFEDFLRPKRMTQLMQAARSGPVVVINVHKSRCDALVLMEATEVVHIPLNGLSYDRAQALDRTLESLVSARFLLSRHIRGKHHPIQGYDDTHLESILAELWLLVVKPVLEGLKLSISQVPDPPRIWWCATGVLSFLPLHAAGLYDTDEPGYKTTDFVVSSYTPTISALLDISHTINDVRLLAVIQPDTYPLSPLPNTKTELLHIQKHAADLPIMLLDGPAATVEHVVQGMNQSSWIHLACHGIQDTMDPMNSEFLLHDGGLKLSDIINLSLPRADFAFLSACQSAAGHKRLSDEAVHLAAGMLLAGYRGVIATMWSIADGDAPDVADGVYEHLFKDKQPRRDQAAYALHHATQRLRKRRVPLFSWVPFIHIGL